MATRRLALLLFLALPVLSQSLATRVQRAIRNVPEARNAHWGISVVSLKTGRLVYGYNSTRLFVPASNTKLFTTALALERLGPDFKFTTVVRADAEPDAAGVVRGVRLIGGGDPNLSNRILPYVPTTEKMALEPIVALESLAEQLVRRGVRVVEGPITGDDTRYPFEPSPSGWAIDDTPWSYGAPVSALSVNDNSFRLRIEPAAETGMPVQMTVSPSFAEVQIRNSAITTDSTPQKLRYMRWPGSGELLVFGSMPQGAVAEEENMAVLDPALYAATALRSALQARGVRVDGGVRALHRLSTEAVTLPGGAILAEWQSAPLADVVKVVNKISQNLHAEVLLREIAYQHDASGTAETGSKLMEEFLLSLSLKEDQFELEDGSGLSRLNLVAPQTVTRLLHHMFQSMASAVWMASLPEGAVDGTLEHRFRAAPSRGKRIRAKTGSLSHVSALGGYALPNYAFCVMVNGFDARQAPIRTLIDRIALELAR
jgi:D-alanyl-D-alanine carboxypeptidase/D-alanyl-D-alanine-endopeptidase (penicillin-binding protein 4)